MTRGFVDDEIVPASASASDPSHKNLPSLDLLRSYAIFSVVTAHTVLAFGAPPSLAPLQLGGTGVDLFFVLSGWLLGRQLMLELRKNGTIRLTRFWSRRGMRTLPAYYAVLAATFLQKAWFHNNEGLGWPYLYFGQNYLPDLTAFYISWSLCVEEHFYLLVGPAILLLSRARSWRLPILVGLLGAPSLFRMLGLYGTMNETHVRWDECAVGVVLAAISVFWPQMWSRLTRYAPVLATAGVVAYAWSFWHRWHPDSVFFNYGQGGLALIFGSLVLLANASEWWQQKLYLPGTGYLAARAYAVYLLHPDSLALLKRLPATNSFLVFTILAWIITLAGAEVLHRLVELPMMRARERFHFSRSAKLSAAPLHVP